MQFEDKFAEYLNIPHAFGVNSPFSANLLMYSMLEHKYLVNGYDKRYFRGDIIVPAICPPWTFLPLKHLGFRINVVDIDENTLNIDPYKTAEAITPHTRAIVAYNNLGNSADYYRLRQLAKDHDILIIEDVTTSFGAIADSDEYCGTIGQFGTFSYGNKGIIVCRTQDDANYIKTLRNGGLMIDHETHKWFKDGHNEKKFLKTDEFKDTFETVSLGYDVKDEDFNNAFLESWPKLKEWRTDTGDYWKTIMRNLPSFKTQKEVGVSSWENLSLVCQGILHDRREEVVNALSQLDIVVRPIYTHVLKNTVSPLLNAIENPTPVADNVFKNGLMIDTDGVNEDIINQINDTLKNLETKIIKG